MGTFGVEFRFPLDERGLTKLKATIEHPEKAEDAYLDEGEISVRVDGTLVLPPWYVPNQLFTGHNWVRMTLLDLDGALRQLRGGESSVVVDFLDSPIAIEFHRENHEIAVCVTADVGPNLTRTPLAETRIRIDHLAAELEDAKRRYDARLAEIDPALPRICGFARRP